MSDKISSFTVALEKDISEEQAEIVGAALLQIRGVISVSPEVTDSMAFVVEQRIRADLAEKLFEVIYPKK